MHTEISILFEKVNQSHLRCHQYADLILILDDFNGYPAILFRYFQFCFYGIVNEIGQGNHNINVSDGLNDDNP